MVANHLPRISVLNGNSDSTGCVVCAWGKGGVCHHYIFFLIHLWFFFCSDAGLFSLYRRHLRSICMEWHLTFLLFYDCFFCSDTGLFSPRRVIYLLSVWNGIWPFSFFKTAWHYHVQCLTHTSLTPVLRGSRLQLHLWLPNPRRYRMSHSKPFLCKLHKTLVNSEERCVLLLLFWRPPRETFKVGLQQLFENLRRWCCDYVCG